MTVRYVTTPTGLDEHPANWIQIIAVLDDVFPDWWKLDDPKGVSLYNMAMAIKELAGDRNQLRYALRQVEQFKFAGKWVNDLAKTALDITHKPHDTI
jgi:hypothetical protein